jgi:hypothetical protein
MPPQPKNQSLVQTGGALNLAALNIQASIQSIDEPWKLVVGFILVLIIAYAGKFGDILDNCKLSLRSLSGRLIGVLAVLLLITQVGWVYGLLGAVALLLVMRGYTTDAEQDADVTVEQFSDLVVKQKQGDKWFVEKVLDENPEYIETDRVETAAIQG